MTWGVDFDPLAPASDGPAGAGDDYLRAIHLALSTVFSGVSTEIEKGVGNGAPSSSDWTALWDTIASLQAAQGAFPVGMITMWAGSVASIPTGWVLCGPNNAPAPDLSDRFIVGVGNTYNPGDTGGSSSGAAETGAGGDGTVNLTISDHLITENNLPKHSHHVARDDAATNDISAFNTLAKDWRNSGSGESGEDHYILHGAANSVADVGLTNEAGGVSSPSGLSHSGATVALPSHTHTLSGGLPPYYALCYIYYTG